MSGCGWNWTALSVVSVPQFRTIYKKWNRNASIKSQIGRLSQRISVKIEEILNKDNIERINK